MKLKSIQFSEYDGKPEQWHLEDCTLSHINLIVGKNATGKTRTLNVIAQLTDLLTGHKKLTDNPENFTVIFDKNNVEMTYRLSFNEYKEVIEEKLWQGDKFLLQRNKEGRGTILTEPLGKQLDFQPPLDELAVVNRRDAIQHPFLEDLYWWGKSARYFQFGTPMGQDNLATSDIGLTKLNLKHSKQVVAIFREGVQKYGKNYVQRIIDDMHFCGYELENISVQTLVMEEQSNYSVVNGIQVKEKDLNAITSHSQISSGMFRVLSLFIQLNYSILASLPSCILIDEIGEGLDYTRSAALIKRLMSLVTDTKMQLIMSTNDQFVMDAVPLKYWSIIKRSAGVAKLYNYFNSATLFDNFKFTGLGNFDFFASNDYLEEK